MGWLKLIDFNAFIESDMADDPMDSRGEERGEGWASWAWSMVPAVLPAADTESSDDESETPPAPRPPVFDISFYNKRATLVIKVKIV